MNRQRRETYRDREIETTKKERGKKKRKKRKRNIERCSILVPSPRLTLKQETPSPTSYSQVLLSRECRLLYAGLTLTSELQSELNLLQTYEIEPEKCHLRMMLRESPLARKKKTSIGRHSHDIIILHIMLNYLF